MSFPKIILNRSLCILKVPDLFNLNILKFYYAFERGTLPHYLQSYDILTKIVSKHILMTT